MNKKREHFLAANQTKKKIEKYHIQLSKVAKDGVFGE